MRRPAPDQKNNTLGFAMKLFGVTGPTLATDNPLATTADLIFQNSDIFFVDNAQRDVRDLGRRFRRLLGGSHAFDADTERDGQSSERA